MPHPPTAPTAENQLPGRTISSGSRSMRGGRYVDLLTPKFNYLRPEFAKNEAITERIICREQTRPEVPF